MIVSAFSDSERKDKIAEFYDTTYPCSFMRGLLTEAQEQEKDVAITFIARQKKSYYSEEFFKANETPTFSKEQEELLNNAQEQLEEFFFCFEL